MTKNCYFSRKIWPRVMATITTHIVMTFVYLCVLLCDLYLFVHVRLVMCQWAQFLITTTTIKVKKTSIPAVILNKVCVVMSNIYTTTTTKTSQQSGQQNVILIYVMCVVCGTKCRLFPLLIFCTNRTPHHGHRLL